MSAYEDICRPVSTESNLCFEKIFELFEFMTCKQNIFLFSKRFHNNDSRGRFKKSRPD